MAANAGSIRWKGLNALAIACALAGCSRANRPFRAAEIAGLDGIRLVKFNHVGQQSRWDCGIGALAMVYGYWGDPMSYDRIASELFGSGGARRALTAAALKDHAQSRGYQAFVLRADLEDIVEQINKGRPVIVCRRIFWGVNHYEVVFGYDAKRKEVLIDDPARGQMRRSESLFRRQHKGTREFALLVVPK